MKITDHERQAAIARLESSRDKLLATIAGISDEQAAFKPMPERWSILQLVEHLATSDPGLMGLIRRALAGAPQPELMEQAQKHDHRFHGELKPFPRGLNKAPENLQPKSVYASLTDAAAAFERAREATIAYARSTDDDLRSHFAPHPLAGPMDAYQWLLACAIHVESHVLQIEELKSNPDFPR
jgi:uncharacterized damage-inducible protein DinB